MEINKILMSKLFVLFINILRRIFYQYLLSFLKNKATYRLHAYSNVTEIFNASGVLSLEADYTHFVGYIMQSLKEKSRSKLWIFLKMLCTYFLPYIVHRK